MDHQEQSIKMIEERYAAMTLEEEEAGGVEYEELEGEEEGIDTRWALVGRFLSDIPIDFNVMKNMMAGLWKPGKGMYVKELGNNRYLFQMAHEISIEKRVPVEGICKVCGSDVESIYHCLIWCNFARSCWAIVGLDGVGNQYSSFQSWMEEVSNTCSEKLELAGMLCWGIWKARNELVWNSSASRAARDSAGEMIEAKARVYSGVMDS
ncbi:hypothetical protein POM88_007199 [Heracleum sosnowskyi]|uniref:DUF4283 domain-containing protein n=1 Tax=Heracleum sosnowskyi TaxID=360622 RepID=A0AAD8N689_9APIA|nr:hypothetical protein POM88_007199 [Heracleum sosnowskyi]